MKRSAQLLFCAGSACIPTSSCHNILFFLLRNPCATTTTHSFNFSLVWKRLPPSPGPVTSSSCSGASQPLSWPVNAPASHSQWWTQACRQMSQKLRLTKPSFPVIIANWKDSINLKMLEGVFWFESKQKKNREKETGKERKVYLRFSVEPFLIYPCTFQLQEWLNPSTIILFIYRIELDSCLFQQKCFWLIQRFWVFFSVSCGENTQQSRRGQQDRIRLTWTIALKEVSFSSAGALMPQCQLSNPIIQAGYDCVWLLPGTGRTRTDTRISQRPAAGRAQPHIGTLA